MNELRLEELSAKQFAELVATEFSVTADRKHHIALRLTSVTEPRVTAADATHSRYESFSLFFDGPVDQPLIQQIYSFEHPQLGRFDLFIVPVSKEREHMQYEAVFNRLMQDG